MKRPSRKRVVSILRQEWISMSGTNRYEDSAELKDGTMVISYLHRTESRVGPKRVALCSRRILTVKTDGQLVSSTIVESWWE